MVRGSHVPRVARLLGVAERAVRNWVNGYNRHGLSGVRDQVFVVWVCRLWADWRACPIIVKPETVIPTSSSVFPFARDLLGAA